MIFENPIEKQIAWIGKTFMEGSGYEGHLHEELVNLRKEVEKTNRWLETISKSLSRPNQKTKKPKVQ